MEDVERGGRERIEGATIAVLKGRKRGRERGREKKKEKEMPTIVRRACFIQGNVLNRNKCGQFYSAEFTHSQGYIMHNGGDSTRGIHSSIR